MAGARNGERIFVRNVEGRSRSKWNENIKMDFK
jgi:hypothetical protein